MGWRLFLVAVFNGAVSAGEFGAFRPSVSTRKFPFLPALACGGPQASCCAALCPPAMKWVAEVDWQ